MSKKHASDMTVVDWENFLSDRGNTKEISYHGGGNYLSMALRSLTYYEDCVAIYTMIVQATLNKWHELDSIERDGWEVNPIHSVADASFPRGFFMEDFRPQYNRLWKESPRPHSDTHHHIALNSGAELPVTRAEVGLLFELPQWSLIAARIASKKGWNNDSIALMEDMFDHKVELRTDSIVEAVEWDSPKLRVCVGSLCSKRQGNTLLTSLNVGVQSYLPKDTQSKMYSFLYKTKPRI